MEFTAQQSSQNCKSLAGWASIKDNTQVNRQLASGYCMGQRSCEGKMLKLTRQHKAQGCRLPSQIKCVLNFALYLFLHVSWVGPDFNVRCILIFCCKTPTSY